MIRQAKRVAIVGLHRHRQGLFRGWVRADGESPQPRWYDRLFANKTALPAITALVLLAGVSEPASADLIGYWPFDEIVEVDGARTTPDLSPDGGPSWRRIGHGRHLRGPGPRFRDGVR